MCWANFLAFQSKKRCQEIWSSVLPSNILGEGCPHFIAHTMCLLPFLQVMSNYLAIFKGRGWGTEQKQACDFNLLVKYPFPSPSITASPPNLMLLHFLNGNESHRVTSSIWRVSSPKQLPYLLSICPLSEVYDPPASPQPHLPISWSRLRFQYLWLMMNYFFCLLRLLMGEWCRC